MELEAAISYLLALAVPLWLVGEYVVHAWKPSNSPQPDGQSLPARPSASTAASRAVAASRLTGSRKPA